MVRQLYSSNIGWPHQDKLTSSGENTINKTIVPAEKVLLPTLHVKLRQFVKFVKSQSKDEKFFRYLCSKFPKLSETKLRERVFSLLDVRKLLFHLLLESMEEKRK
ncbi:uncharacterized protein TNIN_403801 [Trichonephila inaurata madagascariensis]|uniref:Uncharacterized protein n=1 Tax=Trichonephila inaurata madagascariensis TaxID=2747483 RepID=A0A8X6XR03_9ARAC|nr:uncharacterized protein TNIN_403801 [Trichonephila inaurata madagascariensis]